MFHAKQIRRLEQEIQTKRLLVSDLRLAYYESNQSICITTFNRLCDDIMYLEQELLHMRIGCCLHVEPYSWVNVFKNAAADKKLKRYSKAELIEYFSYRQDKFLEFIYK